MTEGRNPRQIAAGGYLITLMDAVLIEHPELLKASDSGGLLRAIKAAGGRLLSKQAANQFLEGMSGGSSMKKETMHEFVLIVLRRLHEDFEHLED